MNFQHAAENYSPKFVLVESISLGHLPPNVQYFANILFHWMQLHGQRPKRILNCMLHLFALELLPCHQCSRCSQNIILGHLGLQIWQSVESVPQRWPQDVPKGLSCPWVNIWMIFSGVCLLCFNLLNCHPLDVPVNENTSTALAHAGLAIWVAILHVLPWALQST